MTESSLRSVLAMLAVAACTAPSVPSPESDPTGSPTLEVELIAAFDDAAAGEVVTTDLWVANGGTDTLEIRAIDTQGDTAFGVTEPFWPFELQPGQSTRIGLSFAPPASGHGAFDGVVTVATDDPRQPEVAVPLRAARLDPSLQFSELVLDLGEVDVPCAAAGEIAILNAGDAELQLDEVSVQGDGSIRIVGLPEPAVRLAPGEEHRLDVFVDVAELGERAARITATTDEGVRHAEVRVTGVDTGWRTDVFTQDAGRYAMLLVVDRSPDGVDLEKALQSGLPRFLDALVGSAAHWSLGIATADDGCVNLGVLTEESSDLELKVLEAARGAGGQLTESLLELVDRATSLAEEGECNAGLFDPSAPLHVVVVSDADDESGIHVDALVDTIADRLDDPSLLTVSAAVDVSDTCGTVGARYLEAVDLTGGLALDLCEEFWAPHLEELPSWSAPIPATGFPLTRTPNRDTITVTVDGRPATDWSWDQDSGRLEFDAPPPPGATIAVTYADDDICD